jgi:flagellar basal body-associated protein FliL
MNFSSVLFSKEHIISPFKINHKNKEISIKDKKIKTIALSILVGILTAGIGGIILFYCLSAKYKLDKLNINNIDTFKKNTQNTSSKPKAASSIKRKKGLDLKDKEFINDFVSSFLHPYITGKISREDDSKDRKPMIELLKEKMPGFELSMKDEVEEIALNIFFEKAALGLYVNQKRGALSGDITSESSEFKILIKALTKALPREFPSRKISNDDLRIKASEALVAVNEERKNAQEKALDFKVKGNPNLCHKKLSQLKDSGQLFLA